MKVHIGRAHGIGESVERVKSAREDAYGSSGSYKSNDNNSSSNRSMRGTSSLSSKIAATNKISEAHKIWPGSAIVDQYYLAALEFEENRKKVKKIREVFGEIPFSDIQQINAEPLDFSSEIASEPPISPVGTSFQKKYSISPSVESNTAIDCDMRKITESHRTTQEKPEGLTFEEYRTVWRTPVSDREYARSGKGWVRRNLFGDIVDFSI